MKKTMHVAIVVCLMLVVACFSGCGKKREYKGYVPVTQAEAEAFAGQLIEKFKQGDKKPFFDFGTDLDAAGALSHLINPDIDAQMKSHGMPDLSAEQRKAVAEGIVTMNHAYFDSLKSVERVGTEEQLGLFSVVLDCQFDQTSKMKLKGQKFLLMLIKKKGTGEIVVASYHPHI
jgi:hypothetical protein